MNRPISYAFFCFIGCVLAFGLWVALISTFDRLGWISLNSMPLQRSMQFMFLPLFFIGLYDFVARLRRRPSTSIAKVPGTVARLFGSDYGMYGDFLFLAQPPMWLLAWGAFVYAGWLGWL